MLIVEQAVKTKASINAVWRLYEDVSIWPKWDHGLESVILNGAFIEGSTGKLKPKGGPVVKFMLTEVVPKQLFRDRSFLPFCEIHFFHELRNLGSEVVIRHRVEMTGALAFVFSILIGRGIKQDFSQTMANLVSLAEESLEK